jgi:ABC-type nitrate/sulfonate/bicarbonate transport system substrate-binding protein
MVAKEMTYFEEEGLEDYEVVTGGLVPGLVEKIALRRAMKEKGIDIVADPKPISLFHLSSKGEDIYIVGCWRNHQDFRFVGRKGKGLKTLADLKGKSIGIRDFGGIDHALIRVHLRRAGLDPERDVTWLRGSEFHLARDVAAESLRRGLADCIPIPSRAIVTLLAEGYPLLLDTLKLYPQGLPVRVIATTRRVLEEKGEALESYLRATIRAYWFIMDKEKNGDYVRALDRRLHRQSPDEEEQTLGALEGSGRNVLPLDGSPSLEGLRTMLEEAQEMGEIPAQFTSEKVLWLEPVRRAFQALSQREDLAPALKRAREIYQRENQQMAA